MRGIELRRQFGASDKMKRHIFSACALPYLLLICVLGQGWSQRSNAVQRQQPLPTGMSITPTAAPGSKLLFLNPDLPGMPEFLADHPISTALSPDGRTLLVLTSGFNRNYDIKAKIVPALSNEYVFVYDVTQNPPVKRQVLPVENTHMGIAWAPDGLSFYVAGGSDDNLHVFTQQRHIEVPNGWAESLPPIALGHAQGLGLDDEETSKDHKNKPVAAGVALTRDGKRLLIANNMNDSVSLIDLAQRKVVTELDLRPGKGRPGGEYPYDVAIKGDDKAYVSCLRDR